MTARVPDPRVLPGSVADDRGRAVLALMTRISGSFTPASGLAVTWADVPASYLPYAVRSLSLQALVQPGMREDVVRRLIAGRWELHALQGKVAGVRYGLGLLGMSVEWVQWFATTPMGPPGTYVATITFGDELFEGEGRAITARAQRAAAAMVDYMKRWSQDGALRVRAVTEVPLRVGMQVRTRLRVRPTTTPITGVVAPTPLRVGAQVRLRPRVRPLAV